MDKQIDKSQLRRESYRRYIKWGIVAAAIMILIVIGIFSMRKSVMERDLRIAVVEEGPLETTVAASGRVVPAFEEIINSPVDTRILKVFVQPGDSVAEGMPLLQLDLESAETNYDKLCDEQQIREHELTQLRLNNSTQLSELAMQIEVKQMEVSRLEVEVANEKKLDSLGSGTGERVRQAQTAYMAGTLELKQLRERLANEKLRSAAAEKAQKLSLSSFNKDMELMRRTLDRGRIPAPHAGVVTFISNEIGSRVGTGEKVAVVADLSHFKINGEVPEGNGDRIGIGSAVKVRIGGTELTGNVANITPQAKSGTIAFIVDLDDDRNPRLRSGVRAELYVSYGYKDKVMRIPGGQYFKGPGEYELFVQTDDTSLEKRKVRLGDSNREYVEVLSGLNPGDRVVVSDMDAFSKSGKLKIKK